MADREVIEMVKRYVLLLNAEGISVSRVFLFGSYSIGTANEHSDIDVMLVSDRYDENDDAAIGKAWHLTRRISTKIEPFLVGAKKFNTNDVSPLISSVKTSGIEIVV